MATNKSKKTPPSSPDKTPVSKDKKEKAKKETLIEKLNHEESLFGDLLVHNHEDITKAKKNKKSSK